MDRADLKPLVNTAATIGRVWIVVARADRQGYILSKAEAVALTMRLEQERN